MKVLRHGFVAAALASICSFAHADIGGAPAGNYIRNQTNAQPKSAINISTATINTLTAGRCVQTGTGGLLTITAGPCGSSTASTTGQIVASPQYSIGMYSGAGSTTTITGDSRVTLTSGQMKFWSSDLTQGALVYNSSVSTSALRIDGFVGINQAPTVGTELSLANLYLSNVMSIKNGQYLNFLTSTGGSGATISNPYGAGVTYLYLVSGSGVGINRADANFPGLTVDQIKTSSATISSGTVTASLNLGYISSGQCLQTGTNGLISGSGSACGTGSGGTNSIVASPQFRIGYYSGVGSTNAITGASAVTTNGAGAITFTTATLAPTTGLGANILYGPNDSIFGGSGAGNLTTQYATCFGVGACSNSLLGVGSIGLGFFGGAGNIGSNSIAIGSQALGQSAVAGLNNIAIGQDAMSSVNSASTENNIAIGQDALTAVTSYGENTAVGWSALKNTTSGFENHAFGVDALTSNTTGWRNVAVGSQGLYWNLGGIENTAIGDQAGGNFLNPEYAPNPGAGFNTFLGALTGVISSNTFVQRSVAIGYLARVGCTDCAVIGSTQTDFHVGVGSATPVYNLAVAGSSGAYINAELNAAQATVRDLTSGMCVQAGTGGRLTTSGAACGAGGGGASGQVNSATQLYIPFYSVSGSSNVLSGSPGISVTTITATSVVNVSSAIRVIPATALPNAVATGAVMINNSTNFNSFGLTVYTTAQTQTALSSLAFLDSGATSYNEPMLWIRSQSTSTIGANADLLIHANNPDIEFRELDQYTAGSGVGQWEIAVNFDNLQISPRNTGDTSFQAMITFDRSAGIKFKEMDGNEDYVAWRASTTLPGASYSYVWPSAAPTANQVLGYIGTSGSDYNTGWVTVASGGGASGAVNAANQGLIPYYSVAGSSNVLSGVSTISTTSISLLASTETNTAQKQWTSVKPSTFSYGVSVGSLTVMGAGAGVLTLLEGAVATVPPLGIGYDQMWADSSSHTFVFTTNGGVNMYTVVGTSVVIADGNFAKFSGHGTLVDGGFTSAVPVGPEGAVQFNTGGILNGVSRFNFSGSSLTVVSSVSITGAQGSHNSSVGFVDIFSTSTATEDGKIIFNVGSNTAGDQLWVANGLYVYGKYGFVAAPGSMGIGRTALPYSITTFNTVSSGTNQINFANGEGFVDEMSFVTNTSTGGVIAMMPQGISAVRVSSLTVQIQASTTTVEGAKGLNVTYGATVGSMTVSNLASGKCVETTTGGLLTAAAGACGSGSGGVTVYPATATASFPFGLSASTMVLINATDAYILRAATSTTAANLIAISTIPATNASDFLLNLSSTSGTLVFGVENNSHVISSGTIPVLSSCGSSPSILGSDAAFEVTVGATTSGCTITFGSAYAVAPACVVTDQTTSVVNALGYTISATAISLSKTSMGGDKIDVICVGRVQ